MDYFQKHLKTTIQNIIENNHSNTHSVPQSREKQNYVQYLKNNNQILNHLNRYTSYLNDTKQNRIEKKNENISSNLNEYVGYLNAVKKSSNSKEKVEEINKYVSYLKETKKQEVVTKKETTEIPEKIKFNGHVYFYNEILKNFVNQYGHKISIDQAVILSRYQEEENSFGFDYEVTSSDFPSVDVIVPPDGIVEFVTLGSSDSSVDMEWTDLNESESGFKVYYREVVSGITAPAAPTGFTAERSGPETIQLQWTDISENEDGFKIFYSEQ